MTTFTEVLNSVQAAGKKVYVEFAGGVYPAKIASFSDDYVLLLVDYNGQTLKVHRHYSIVSLVGS